MCSSTCVEDTTFDVTVKLDPISNFVIDSAYRRAFLSQERAKPFVDNIVKTAKATNFFIG